MKLNWEKESLQPMEVYLDKEEAVQVFIIKTGFEDTYILVYDDAYKQLLGKCDVYSKKRIKEEFGIEIQI